MAYKSKAKVIRIYSTKLIGKDDSFSDERLVLMSDYC